MKYASINGTIIEHDKASLHISDLGLRRGYAVFEFFRVLRGVPVFLEDHLERFERSARLLELTPPFGREKLEALIRELIELNDLREAGLQMLLTGGYSPDAFTPGPPNLIIAPIRGHPTPGPPLPAGGQGHPAQKPARATRGQNHRLPHRGETRQTDAGRRGHRGDLPRW
ncbi:aminotransferase class IV [Meiothermus taiwanensis]|uniref:aminotransferase class IV n=1 Tax=Meiothermus taiwanensis TaxID=172827 RepID=UPI000AAA1461|nr:aminotransferase class IV [Meiothermus taiwanensis]